eukprot:SAG31_NODE_5711_length_2368_cov_2.665491_2_plen_68_part_00
MQSLNFAVAIKIQTNHMSNVLSLMKPKLIEFVPQSLVYVNLSEWLTSWTANPIKFSHRPSEIFSMDQ